MMHESTVVDLSGPCHHQPPTLSLPHTPSVHASLGNQFRFVPIQHASPPAHRPPPPIPTIASEHGAPNPNPISRTGQWKPGNALLLHRHRQRRRGRAGRRRGRGHEQSRSLLARSCSPSLQEHDGAVRICAASSPIKPIIRMQQPSARLGMKQTSGPFLPPKPRLRVDITHWMERNLPPRPH